MHVMTIILVLAAIWVLGGALMLAAMCRAAARNSRSAGVSVPVVRPSHHRARHTRAA